MARTNLVRWPLFVPGGILLSIATSFDLIAFSNILTTFLTQLFSALLAVLLGSDPAQLFNGSGLV